MHTNWLKRLLIGMGCALLLGAVTAVIVLAQSDEPPTTPVDPEDCGSCHEEIATLWESGTHSQASALAGFVKAWQEQGSPDECLACHTTGYDPATGQYETEGVACQVCHPSAPHEHPQKIMYTDTSSRLCGQCHTDTFNQLEDSQHGQEGMACIRCHNPHDNGLRAGGVEDTCRACHQEETHFYSFTGHAMEGLLCTDCHFQLADGDMGNGHGSRQHNFTVGEQNCTECHGGEMHYPLADQETAVGAGVDPMMMQAGFMPPLGDTDSHNLNSQPQNIPNTSVNFIILAAITGMLFGLIGSPWVEKQFRRDDTDDKGSK